MRSEAPEVVLKDNIVESFDSELYKCIECVEDKVTYDGNSFTRDRGEFLEGGAVMKEDLDVNSIGADEAFEGNEPLIEGKNSFVLVPMTL